MRLSWLALVAGCGHTSMPLEPPDAMPDMSTDTCTGQTTMVYLARTGGSYTPGPNDSRANTSSLLSASHTFAAYDSPSWAMAHDCIVQQLAPFEISVTESDPGTAPHLEIVLSPADGSEIGISAQQSAIYASSCDPDRNAIAFVWPKAVSDDPTTTCKLVVQAVGMAGGLEFTTACHDAMSFDIIAPQCGGGFVDMPLQCGAGQPAACRCSPGTTQDSFQKMAKAFGRCP
jgi:hypothetical protein